MIGVRVDRFGVRLGSCEVLVEPFGVRLDSFGVRLFPFEVRKLACEVRFSPSEVRSATIRRYNTKKRLLSVNFYHIISC